MQLFSNPVLQRELLVNLRKPKAFGLLLMYQVLLAAVVYFAWPSENVRLDLSDSSPSSELVDLVFLGQYILAALMAPSFAAGSIAGEKERMTYEMLLASPIRPASIVFGKLVAALTHLAVLIFASLPIVMLCLPLGGVSFYEVLAAYLALIASVITFGMISVAAGSFFSRTSSALVVSYLMILPMALAGVLFWASLSQYGEMRLFMALTVIPAVAATITISLFFVCSSRMLYPPDFGSEGKEVINIEDENKNAIGVVIVRDQFPDRLLAPPSRNTLMPDGMNPVYDKEMRSEIFGQGTLMLRLAIQVSMILALPLMAYFLFISPALIPWYVSYVVLFNLLIGPVFSAGSVTSERERQTLDLLLTTSITPWQILWGKLLSGLRVSSVLTLFLLWPLLLKIVFGLLEPDAWRSLPTMLAFLVIYALTCLSTSMLALFFSTVCRKTSTSLMVTYSVILVLYVAPLATTFFANTYYPTSPATSVVNIVSATSPFAAAHNLPLYFNDYSVDDEQRWEVATSDEASILHYPLKDLVHFGCYLGFAIVLNVLLFASMIYSFNSRWRISSSSS